MAGSRNGRAPVPDDELQGLVDQMDLGEEGEPGLDTSPLTSERQAPGQQAQDTTGVAASGTPSLEKLWVSQMQTGWNTVKELLTGSRDPSEYLPRSRLDKSVIARDTRIVGRLWRLQFGYTDVSYLIWWQYHSGMGEGGKARQEIIELQSGSNMARRGFASRFRTMGQNQEVMVQ